MVWIFLIAFLIFVVEIAITLRKIGGIRQFRDACDHPWVRCRHALTAALGQKRVCERWWGYAHTLIFYAFLVFLWSAFELLVQDAMPSWHLYDWIGRDGASVLHVIETIFAWMTLVALGIVAIRRLVCRTRVHNTPEAWIILALIALIMMSHLAVMASLVAMDGETPWFAEKMVLTHAISTTMTSDHAAVVYRIAAFIHILCIAIFLVWIPRGKHLHILYAFPSLFFQFGRYDASGKEILAPSTPDLDAYAQKIEAAIDRDLPEDAWPTLGVRKIGDLSPVMKLNAFACMQCRRCTNVCPLVAVDGDAQKGAMQTMIWLRRALELGNLNQKAVDVLWDENHVWQCTQCGACDRACPVGVHHTERILDMRRELVASEAAPTRLNGVFANVERSGNPWGYARADRKRWTASIPKANANPSMRILVFAGCMGAYDAKSRKTLEHAAQWLVEQGFEVVALERETCCGEPIRKLGNESEFQACMRENWAQFDAVEFDLIVTICPHCAQTLSEDYVRDGKRLRANHFLELVMEFYRRGRLEIAETDDERFEEDEVKVEANRPVLHLPCRFAKLPETPRHFMKLMRALGVRTCENDVAQAHCCGAGGGQFFLEGERQLSSMRATELCRQNPKTVASCCPFCMQVLGDEFLRRDGAENEVHPLIEMVNVIDICAARTRILPETDALSMGEAAKAAMH